MGDTQKNNIVFRFGIVYIFILLFFVLVVVKITRIISEREQWISLQSKGKKNEFLVKPKRGNIYSSDGRLMASTVPTYRIYMDTKVPALREKNGKLFYENIDSVSICLSKFLKEKSLSEYKRDILRAYERGDGRFLLHPKRISYSQLKELRTFPLFRLGRYKSGLITEEYVQRVKPFSSLASRTIGDVYPDESKGGKNGLELYFDALLRGRPGVAVRQKYANTWQESIIAEPVDGMDIETCIDVELQDIAENALLETLRYFNASDGCVILMETKTGEVKAIVNMQKNSNGTYSENVNGAVSYLMEPGSTFKIASIMVALDDGKIKLTDSIDTGKGIYYFSGKAMKDHNYHKDGYGKISVEDGIQGSSNIVVSRAIVNSYGKNPEQFVDGLYRMKLQEDLKIKIPGAAKPYIKHPKDSGSYFSSLSLPWMSIGYELQMPPIYTLNFFNAIANNGKMIQPVFVKRILQNGKTIESFHTTTINSSICKQSTLKDIKKAMEGVVVGKHATAKQAYSNTVSIAGKTGTAQLSQGRKGYKASGRARHAVSFCGYFPAEKPLYTGIVVVREPQYSYISSGLICGKTFKNIAERTMAIKTEKTPKEKALDSLFMTGKPTLPRIKSGNYKALKTVVKAADIPISGESSDWVKTENTSNEIKITPLSIQESLVPNVKGMGARDAVYLLQKEGFNVQLEGRGRVVSQSVLPGGAVVKGQTVVLSLK